MFEMDMNHLRYIGDRPVGPDHPVFIAGEIGINHNGNLSDAIALIDVAVDAGCDAVKFQKRTPELCVPAEQQSVERDTPWGRMSYLAYRHRVEFNEHQYGQIARHCENRGIAWFASPWDLPSVDFLEMMNPPAHKIASACLTDDALRREFPDVVIGYSGHEIGLQTTLAAVALGASFVERHITLDRASWGSDQAASVEPVGLQRLVRDIRTVEAALGDGVKRVYDSELPVLRKLRRYGTAEGAMNVAASQDKPISNAASVA
jgi:N-acetylneuraminate synthase